MKYEILKLSTLIFLFFFIGAGCQKDEFDYADESIEVLLEPGISIYKTNNDYFNYISVKVTTDGKLNAIPGYNIKDSRINIDKNGKVSLNFRWRLRSGYIVDKETYKDEIFTDITVQEYVDWNTQNSVECWPDDLIEPRIIDKDPFTEFYYLNGINKKEKVFTLKEINNLIENGTLENVFTKLK